MQQDRCGLLVCAVAVIGLSYQSASLRAADLLPPDRSVAEVVDHYIDAGLAAENRIPAPPADDAAYIRRVTLDLCGRIPTIAEVQHYVQSQETDKQVQLVERLLESPDFAFHQRNELDVLLISDKGPGEWRDWLLKTQVENRRWPEIFRSLMLPREADAGEKGAAAFLKSRAANLDDMTNDTSRLFFGVSINCAKCHDHPLVSDWKQDHYFGMASFFNRTYLTKKQFLAEREDGQLKFRTKAGEEKQARLLFLTSAEIREPLLAEKSEGERKAAEDKEKTDNERETPPEPASFSRRAQLIDVALRPDPAGFFPRSFVNRQFARLFGRGLVNPLDQMHSENEPSHPELLTWLARDTDAHGYDLKHLLKGLVLSRAYARTSRWDQPGERPADRLFAVAPVRPLTPMQYALSLIIASRNPDELAKQQQPPERWAGFRRDLENHAAGFAQQLEIPGENFQVSVSEALLFNNGGTVADQFLRDSGDWLVGYLKGLATPQERSQILFLATLSRTPEPAEIDAIERYLADRADRIPAALGQLVWTLLTGSEFRFNH